MTVTLHIGNKRLSSWSMRPWLVLKKAGIGFTENLIPLDQDDTSDRLLALSPAGTVPVLETGDLRIWDSLAICEWVAEQKPGLWPADAAARAIARAACASIHSGFVALRATLSMDLQRPVGPVSAGVECWADIERMERLWASAATGEGPFLFGEWSIADAFFTPVAARLRTYDIPVSDASAAYVDALLADPVYQEWESAARLESFAAPFH